MHWEMLLVEEVRREGVAYKVPMPNMMQTTMRCAFGICNFQIVGRGRKQSRRSVTMFTPAQV
jgi:hypothetical protein